MKREEDSEVLLEGNFILDIVKKQINLSSSNVLSAPSSFVDWELVLL